MVVNIETKIVTVMFKRKKKLITGIHMSVRPVVQFSGWRRGETVTNGNGQTNQLGETLVSVLKSTGKL